jgi:hypothetical protein
MVACKTRSTIDRIHLLRVLAFRAGSLCRSKRGVNMSSTSRLACLVSLLIVSGALTNCASTKEIKSRIAGRWGPDPAIQATDTDDAMDRQMAVLQIIADRADIGTPSADGKHFVLSSDDLMRVVEAGFNVGREDCEVYMDNLFRMARERQRNDSVINAASIASNAILQATAAQKAISIVGASLGMLTGVNDAVYDSYLFAQAPSLIGEKVRDVQATYRDLVERNKSSITTPEKAYNAIQNYYSYCLPHSIEGLLLQKIADSNPVVTPQTTPPKKPAAAKPVTGTTTSINQRVKLQ